MELQPIPLHNDKNFVRTVVRCSTCFLFLVDILSPNERMFREEMQKLHDRFPEKLPKGDDILFQAFKNTCFYNSKVHVKRVIFALEFL